MTMSTVPPVTGERDFHDHSSGLFDIGPRLCACLCPDCYSKTDGCICEECPCPNARTQRRM